MKNTTKKVTFKSLSENELFINLSESNRKLVPNKNIKFLIWNIPAVTTCPYRTSMCEHSCYALKAERLYKDCLTSRKRNFEISRGNNFVERMCFTIDAYMSKESYKNAKRVIYRIHESGDFYNQTYFDAWVEIATYCKKYSNLVFIAYTKSIPYVETSSELIPNNLVIRYSIWADTKPEHIELAKKLNLPIYTADTESNVNKAVASGTAFKCVCADCASCQACMNTVHKKIVCVIH